MNFFKSKGKEVSQDDYVDVRKEHGQELKAEQQKIRDAQLRNVQQEALEMIAKAKRFNANDFSDRAKK